ncbi:hypothetical protein ABES58_05900 [Paenibacillus lautus]|uniref:hypothetical protein n=1 Tax=Paenibacillus lautus TaxID=1401 RepID=UPI003D2C457A
MANWLALINLKGDYTSPVLDFPLRADGVISKVLWQSEQPVGSQIIVQTRVNLNGHDWSDWKTCVNGGPFPDLNDDSHLDNPQYMFRILFKANSYQFKPRFKSIQFEFEPVLVFDNKGDLDCKPEVWITKYENGDFSIQNISHNLEEFKFTELIDGETLYVNNDSEDIETTLPVTYRYRNFNDHYLRFPIGKNVLRVSGKADIRFRYQFKTLQ